MKIGYLLDTHAGPYDGPIPDREQVARSVEAFIAEAELCERVGFDSVQVPERHMRTECHFPTSLQLLSMLAVRTERVRLATHSLVATLYHPMQIAEQAAMIDLASRGRMILTLAMGYHPDYWRMFGIDGKERRDRFIETVEIIDKAFTSDEPFSYDGKHFPLENVVLTPRAYQTPRPELWLGGHFHKAIERAGKYGDAWCSDPFPIDPDVWARKMEVYHESCARHGREPKVVIMREVWCAPTMEQALKQLGEHHLPEHLFYFRQGIFPEHPDFRSESDFTVENMLGHIIVGSPQDCLEQLASYEERYDVDECIIRFRMPTGPSFEDAYESIELFGTEVLSQLQPA
jgi:alkanesulfonate monooxygenase SsuD/methylene tetrahydromethanopterin reductase-like flavin-dependent oxidoreductase (luciferase family)